MTDDLDRLWDDLPVGPAPLDAILREARGARRPARGRRPLLVAAVAGGVAAAFVAGVLVTRPGDVGAPSAGPGDGPGAGPVVAVGLVPAAFHGALRPAASCEALLQRYQAQAVRRVGPYGWDSPVYNGYYPGPVRRLSNDVHRGELQAYSLGRDLDTAARGAMNPQTTRSTDSDTGTNVQEAGVDEPDSVKTDGTTLVRLREGTLTTYDVSGPKVRLVGSLDLDHLQRGQILLAGHTVVALGTEGRRTHVSTVDVSDPAVPTLVDTATYGAPLDSARQHGDDVRLILRSALPPLHFAAPGRGVSSREALLRNRRTVRATTITDWLPQVTTGGRTHALLDCRDVAVPQADLGLGTMTVVGFAADAATQPQAIALAGAAPTAYESADHLYLAAQGTTDAPTREPYDDCYGCVEAGDGTTHLYEFALTGAGASYVGAGEVDGVVADRWAMDETGGVLRLAVSPSSQTGPYTSIVTVHAIGDQLVELGRLDGLGRHESFASVRWFDGLALLATRGTRDPLYAVGLLHPARPRLLRRIPASGTAYLHPLGRARVIGLGTGPEPGGGYGARAALFASRDLTRLRTLSVHQYAPGTRERAAGDPRQFTWVPGLRTAYTVVSRGGTGYVSTLRVAHQRLTGSTVAVEHGRDVADVRLVPLPHDRVVLVTGQTVSFFPPDPR